MTVLVRRPGPPLGGLVEAITYQAGEQPRASVEKILPDPSASLWINLNRDEFRSGAGRAPGTMVAGPRARATVIEFEQGRAHIWVSFALGAPAAFGLPPAAAAGELAPLDWFWRADGASLRDRVLSAGSPGGMLRTVEEALLARLAGPLTPDPGLVAAAAALSAGLPVAAVAGRLGVLPRTLGRRFTAQVGLAPKRFARVRRLQRVVRYLDGSPDADWAAVAAAFGYSDQPHLSDEFRDLADVTPAGYLRSRINGPNHLSVPPR